MNGAESICIVWFLPVRGKTELVKDIVLATNLSGNNDTITSLTEERCYNHVTRTLRSLENVWFTGSLSQSFIKYSKYVFAIHDVCPAVTSENSPKDVIMTNWASFIITRGSWQELQQHM